METKKTVKSYSPEVKERAVRMVLEHQGEHASQWTAITASPGMSSSWMPPLRASVTACRVDERAIIGQARGTRGIGRVHGSICARPQPRTHKAKTRLEK